MQRIHKMHLHGSFYARSRTVLWLILMIKVFQKIIVTIEVFQKTIQVRVFAKHVEIEISLR